jgi:cell division inhibitor SepF
MGLFDKIIKTLAPEDENEYDEQDYVPDQAAYIPRDPRTQDQQVSPAPITSAATAKPQSNTNIMGSAIEMKVVKPDRYEAVADIADLLLSKKTVLLNLENTNRETARRLIDFLSGAAYALGGGVQKVADNTYAITPSNVAVSRENVGAAAQPQQAAPEAEENNTVAF